MSTTQMFQVTFQIKKANPGNQSGKVDAYRQDVRKAIVAAASAHPKDILTVLANNITLGSGEAFDILSVASFTAGTEGQNVLS